VRRYRVTQFLQRIRCNLGDFIDDVRNLIFDTLRIFQSTLGEFGNESDWSTFKQYYRAVEVQLVQFLPIIDSFLGRHYGAFGDNHREELLLAVRLQQQASMLLGFVLELTFGVMNRCARHRGPSTGWEPLPTESDTNVSIYL
jgi:hypothetical protein